MSRTGAMTMLRARKNDHIFYIYLIKKKSSLSHYLRKEQKGKCDQRRHFLDNTFQLDHVNSLRDRKGLWKTVLEHSSELLVTFLVDKIRVFDTFVWVFFS